jgi:DNA-binding IclR family transcriptional regulator
MMRDGQAIDGVQSLERAAAILDLVVTSHRTGVRLVDLAKGTGLNKATVHRILGTLLSLGWVEQHTPAGLLFPGLALLRMGIAAADRHNLVTLAAPHLERLARTTGDTVYLLVRSGNALVCVDEVEGNFPVRVKLWNVGERGQLASNASSLAVLALLPDPDVERIVDAHLATIAELSGLDRAAMLHLVERTRRNGYAHNAGLSVRGLDAIAVAVRDMNGQPLAAVCIAAVAPRLESERGEMVVRWLKDETAALEDTLHSATNGFSTPVLRRLRGR